MPLIPEPISTLTAALSRLPGIGPRSAERIALYLVQAEATEVKQLSAVLLEARERVRLCSVCGALTSNEVCDICANSRRDPTILCIVERPTDVFSVEKSGTFHGKYHVLGGKISPVNGVGPEELRIEHLESRLSTEPVCELIVALGTDVEGDATSVYLAKRFARSGLTITRIAYGLPAGTGLDFADEITLSRALEGRRQM